MTQFIASLFILKHLRISLAIISLLLPALQSATVQASPIGNDYDVTLDADVTDGENFDTEGHFGTVTFDGIAELIPNDFVPLDPLLPGNDLYVNESVQPISVGEMITIWIESEVPNDPLFNNALDTEFPVLFEIGGIYSDRPGSITDYSILVTFSTSDPGTEIFPEFEDITGSGTELDPFLFSFDLDPLDIEGATDLHLQAEITQVPAPGALLLMASGLLGMLGSIRRKRHNGCGMLSCSR